MMDRMRFRVAMGNRLGQVLTPEVAAAIETAAFAFSDLPDRSIDTAQFAPHAYRGLVFAAESFRLIVGELEPLHLEHWHTTEKARQGIPFDPNFQHRFAAERHGELLQFTARTADGKLVGNARFYIYSDLNSQTPGVHEDTFFMLPEARHGFNAVRFWQYAERCLQQLLFQRCDEFEVTTDTKVLHDADGNVIRDVGRLNEYLGYAHVANRFHKRFSKE